MPPYQKAMHSAQSNATLFQLRLLKEISSKSSPSDNRTLYSGAYHGQVGSREYLSPKCSPSRSLETLPAHAEQVAIAGSPFSSTRHYITPSKESKAANPFDESTLLGSIMKNYTSEVRASEMLKRANSVQQPPAVVTARENSPSSTSFPYGPNEHDVVCSRGKVFYSLPGNVRFRNTIRCYISVYLAASSKMDKSAVINKIVDNALNSTKGPTRFLKYHARTCTWSIMGHDQVRDKVGHALREAIYDMERNNKSNNTNAQ
ncbi:hypothetical protein FisN_21Lh084 [Fistulifera solaris]|uniref:DUF6824 domain-containing protein n=1 Tax=Fistulifera solaris TaxID=1519565 RepID=A0A1Z5KJX0_FISSO|nr:hypothetical protein FisN_21Lh084 [Fistulifera solaris]|eukprot:GAX26614.1 hypothetical protein FisN_21Lh084 [Fistulifera solaris]